MGRKNGNRNPRPADHGIADDSEDEEIPEDEAFNSDDERKYGAFFRDKEEGDDEESEDDDSSEGSDNEDSSASSDGASDEEDGDGGQYMLDLLDNLDKKQERNKKESSTGMAAISANTKESEFSSSVVPKASLTLDSLMKGLEDTKGFGVVQKTMKKVAQGSATTAPLARVASNRAQRRLHYDDQSKEVSQWIGAVQQNRQAETLDFRPKERMEVTRDLLVEKFVPTTEFEKQIHAALEEAGQKDEEALLKAEEEALQDDLGENNITLDEYKKRRGQLSKMRALLFSYEQKRHHMKKIKSKKYRRIRKKQKERQKDAEVEAQTQDDSDLEKELHEKEEVERMKERMTLAHKNTSKWAKRVLKRGKNVDVDTRRALSAQLKRADDLLNRMKSTRSGEEEDDSEDEDLLETARNVLADTEDDAEEPAQGNSLLKLAFMQKGVERQREQAREEARQLLRELEASENASDEDGSDEEIKEPPKTIPKMASKEEMKRVLNQDDMVVSQLKHGNSNVVAVDGEINIDVLDSNMSKEGDMQKTGSVSIHTTTARLETSSKAKEPSQADETKIIKAAFVHREKAAPPMHTAQDSNPWLIDQQKAGTLKQRKAKRRTSQGYMVDVERAIDLLDPAKSAQTNGVVEEAKDKSDTISSDKITTLTQEELVRRAFASSAEKEADEEFAREKQAVDEEEEDPTGKKHKNEKGMNNTVSGWGSWAGAGAPPPRPPSRKLPKHLQPPKPLSKRKRADEKKPNVIISEKRIKKTADKFMLAQVPYPFSSREEYEKAMSGGVGREWNVSQSFKDMTRPEVITRAGKVIQPLSKKVKQRRPAAKF